MRGNKKSPAKTMAKKSMSKTPAPGTMGKAGKTKDMKSGKGGRGC